MIMAVKSINQKIIIAFFIWFARKVHVIEISLMRRKLIVISRALVN